MRLDYQEIRDSVAERLNQPEILAGMVEGTFDNPKIRERQIDRTILRVIRQLLREVPQSELDALGAGSASVRQDFHADDTFPLNAIRILSVAIDGSTGEPVSEIQWYLRADSSSANGIYTVIGGKFKAKNSSPSALISVHYVIEPSLTDIQANAIVLPQGYDTIVIDRVAKWLMFADDLEIGKA